MLGGSEVKQHARVPPLRVKLTMIIVESYCKLQYCNVNYNMTRYERVDEKVLCKYEIS